VGSIYGTSKRDTLSATKKADMVFGLGGDDRLFGLSGLDQLYGGAGNDKLYGGNAVDTLYGGLGNDVLAGNKGHDLMYGGRGNDTYLIDSKFDRVTEKAGEGQDTVKSLGSFKLPRNVENLVLLGHKQLKATGNALDNSLTGNSAHNVLDGGAGNDLLDGRGGADSMTGGTGDDTYIVDTIGDTVGERPGEGSDTVISSITYTLTGNVENLTLTGFDEVNGFGNGLDNIITGNDADNLLDGGSGNDWLEGGAGNDTLTGSSGSDQLFGGDGDDIYIIDGAGDTIGDSAGLDEVRTTLSVYTLDADIENLTFIGSGGFTGKGNALDNVITGSNGNDTISGGLGTDTLTGGEGDDTFVLSLTESSDDTITDFAQGSDVVQFRFVEFNAVFVPQPTVFDSGIDQNLFNEAGFSGAQLDGRAQFIFDMATGDLWLDTDGTGAAAATLVVKLPGVSVPLTTADFAIL
jgi:Ca2+-binding RTX toxin-like protein